MLDEAETRAGALNICDEAEDAIVERMRAFGRQALSGWARVSTRGSSRRLQRALTNFGAHEAFAAVESTVKEHYGVTVLVSRAQAVKAAGWGLNTQIPALGDGAP